MRQGQADCCGGGRATGNSKCNTSAPLFGGTLETAASAKRAKKVSLPSFLPSFRSRSLSSVALITRRVRVQASLELFVIPPEAEMIWVILQLLALLTLTPIALFFWHKKTKYDTPFNSPVKPILKNFNQMQTSTYLPADSTPAIAPHRPPPVPRRAARQGENSHLFAADSFRAALKVET